jgi:hypothetical protein
MNSSVRFTTKFTTEITYGTTVTAYKLLNLDGATATYGLSANSSIIAAYMDMYRYFRINRIKIRTISSNHLSYPTYPFILSYLAPGNTADPSSWTDLETKNQVLTFGDPAHIATLDLTLNDLKSVGDWFVTQNDASTEAIYSAGEIWVASSSNFYLWSSPKFAVFVEIDVTFRTLLDPALISSWKNQTISASLPPTQPTSDTRQPEDDSPSNQSGLTRSWQKPPPRVLPSVSSVLPPRRKKPSK